MDIYLKVIHNGEPFGAHLGGENCWNSFLFVAFSSSKMGVVRTKKRSLDVIGRYLDMI